jgi:uncharacterized protein with GYD domain
VSCQRSEAIRNAILSWRRDRQIAARPVLEKVKENTRRAALCMQILDEQLAVPGRAEPDVRSFGHCRPVRGGLARGPPLGLRSRRHQETAGRRRTAEDPRLIAGEEDLPMALYLYQAAYTAESVAAQIKEPQDRIKVVTPALEAQGAKILVGGYPFGEYDVLVIFEAPDDTTAASVALAVAAGGAIRSAKTTRLLSGQEWIESCGRRWGLGTSQRGSRG